MALWIGSPEKELPEVHGIKSETKKSDGVADYKRADGKTEVKVGHLHTMFISLVELTLGKDFSDLGEDNEFTWHQFHVKG